MPGMLGYSRQRREGFPTDKQLVRKDLKKFNCERKVSNAFIFTDEDEVNHGLPPSFIFERLFCRFSYRTDNCLRA